MDNKNNSLEKLLLDLKGRFSEKNLTSDGEKFYDEIQKVLGNPKNYFTEINSGNLSGERLNVLYFSMPESNGKFLISNGAVENNGRPYYKIEFSENQNKGILSYVSQGRDKRAINRYEAYLKPACEIENYLQRELSNQVIQIEPGSVINYGDEFVVDKKIKIMFE